jgi:hypothetical protein
MMRAASIPSASAADLLQQGIFMTDTNHQVDDAELARLGIERVPTDTFLWGGFRYSSARDAVAAAKREQKR